jgi:hypothetical protein
VSACTRLLLRAKHSSGAISPDSQSPPARFSLATLTTGIRLQSGSALAKLWYQPRAYVTGSPSITATLVRCDDRLSTLMRICVASGYRYEVFESLIQFFQIYGIHTLFASAAISDGFGLDGAMVDVSNAE